MTNSQPLHQVRIKAPVIAFLIMLFACLESIPAEAAGRYIVQYRDINGVQNLNFAQDSSVAKNNSPSSLAQENNAIEARARTNIQSAATGIQYQHAISPNLHVVTLPASALAKSQALQNLKKDPNIVSIEEDRLQHHAASPTTQALWPNLWGMRTDSSYGANFEGAWTRATGVGQVVAVIDTGVLPHEDLGTLGVPTGDQIRPNTFRGQFISAGYDFISDCRIAHTCDFTISDSAASRQAQVGGYDLGDYVSDFDVLSIPFSSSLSGCTASANSWHGTHVSGIVAALNNNIGVVGGAYGAKILPLRVLGRCGGYESDTQTAMRWAAGLSVNGLAVNPNPAKVINLSLSTSCTRASCACPVSYQTTIDEVIAAGVSVVVAVGNDSRANAANMVPANCKGVIAVGANTVTGTLADYSNIGQTFDLSAPGGDSHNQDCAAPNSSTSTICSTGNNGIGSLGSDRYVAKSGTSMATAMVSAAVALIGEANPNLTPAKVKALLKASVKSYASAETCTSRGECGSGILNVKNAVDAANSSILIATPDSLEFSNTNGSTGIDVTITNIGNNAIAITDFAFTNIQFYVLSGQSSCQNLGAGASCLLKVGYTFRSSNDSGRMTLTYRNEHSTTNVLSVVLSRTNSSTPSNVNTQKSAGSGCNSPILSTFTQGFGRQGGNTDDHISRTIDVSLLGLLLWALLGRLSKIYKRQYFR